MYVTHDGYDVNGNRTTKSTTGSTTVYSDDTSNRLTSASTNGTTVFAATYDARDRRLYNDESGTDTGFRYDGGTSIEEHRDGEPLKELIRSWGNGRFSGRCSFLRQGTRDCPQKRILQKRIFSKQALRGIWRRS